jgi:hypothetical protein
VIAQVPGGELTLVEQSLVEHVCLGKWLDLAAGGETVDMAVMRSWGESRTCRASVIREILCGRRAPDPDPRGLRLRGARIVGRLDLENLTTDVRLELADCLASSSRNLRLRLAERWPRAADITAAAGKWVRACMSGGNGLFDGGR